MTNETDKGVEVKKKSLLRHNEYYDMQDTFDLLYAKSVEGKTFNNLYEIITCRNNILLAYRNIKRNSGSITAGVNKHTITYWEKKDTEQYVTYIQRRFQNFHPMKVRRTEIPKPDGRMRPLGIPTIEDRFIQQCIKQVLEPVCEAKFNPNSFGFRPNRSTENALLALNLRINKGKCYYVVDVDIKSFFDEVDHPKLLKQMWAIGIQDKKLISIISKMLKAEIEGEGIPTKGVPQGGILSPLLSNIVLNELDWWISDQWETFETRYKYKSSVNQHGSQIKSNKYQALRKSNLKEMFIIRYADDFKIMCKNEETANRIFIATQKWLRERLKLEYSPEKSGVTCVYKHPTEFLGFKIKAVSKGKKLIVHSHMTDKAIKRATEQLRDKIKEIQRHPNQATVNRYNSTVRGLQNYYQVATHVNIDFVKIAYDLQNTLKNRIDPIASKTGYKSKDFLNRYKNNYKVRYVYKIALYPVPDIQTRHPMGFNSKVCNYTVEGRNLIHDRLNSVNPTTLKYLMEHPIEYNSVELNDNRISLFSAQYGKCAITGEPLEVHSMEVHHVIPREMGGDDRYANLIIVTRNVHKLIHATTQDTLAKYLGKIKPDKPCLERINKYRSKVGNISIS